MTAIAGSGIKPVSVRPSEHAMTNQLALMMGAAIVVAVAADLTLYDGDTLLFLSRKFVDLMHWVAFWR